MQKLVLLVAAVLTVAAAPAGAGPDVEQWMIGVVTDFAGRYEKAPNDMAKGLVRRDRSNALCQLSQSPLAKAQGQVRDWTGTITVLDATSDGRGVLAVRLSPQLSVKTINNTLSESLGPPTLIPVGSAVQRAAVAMAIGQKIRFSGTMFPNKDDCARELSLTPEGAMSDPEFLFRFTDLHAAE